MNTEERPLISVVVPAYNESAVLDTFYQRLCDALATDECHYEIVYVDDGSEDETLALMRRQQSADSRITVVELSRNFGKEIALTAGLDFVSGDAAVIIDADLQDPPELIPTLVEHWREGGYDVVNARRTRRRGEGWFKRLSAYLFYRLMNRLVEKQIPEDTGDFRLLGRQALDAVISMRERHRYMKGLYAWVGYSQFSVEYERDPRAAGSSKWPFFQLLNLAFEGLTSFSMMPLRIASAIGLTSAFVALGYGALVVAKKLIWGDPVPGYASLVVLISVIGGAQLMAMGIIGEYVGRIFNETKNRPLYFVRQVDESRWMEARPRRPASPAPEYHRHREHIPPPRDPTSGAT